LTKLLEANIGKIIEQKEYIYNKQKQKMVENGDESIEKKEEQVTTLDTLLPSNCLPLAHQVAGHFYGKGKTKLGKLSSLNIIVVNVGF